MGVFTLENKELHFSFGKSQLPKMPFVPIKMQSADSYG